MLIAALSIIILTGCSTSKSTTDYDDVYSTAKKKDMVSTSVKDQTQVATPDYYQESSENVSGINSEDYETGENVAYGDEPYMTTTETVTTPEGTNYITNNYYEGYGPDDYYDYSYAARIDRYYSPYMGYNYYAPCYTGYYYDPWYWDSYWYMPSMYFGYSWGWGGMYWGYPYYYSYYPYNDYWYGYNDGYWNGYWDGYYGYGYNDYYGNYYYGHRSTSSGSNGSNSIVSKDNPGSVQKVSSPNYFERTTPLLADNFSKGRSSTNSDGGGRSSTNAISNQNVLVANPQNINPTSGRDAEQISSNGKQEPIGRNSTNTNDGNGIIVQDKNTSQNIVQDKQRESNTSARYTYKKPAENSNSSKDAYKPGQTIESNNGSRPSQKYSKPVDHSSSAGNVNSGQQGTTSGSQNRQTYSRPQSNDNNSYSKPSGYNSDSQRNSQPSRSSSNTYSQPSRSSSNSQPSNSSRSYSQPSRSSNSGSYSSPSRSSSSGSYSSPSRSSSSSGSSSSRSSSGGSSSGGSSRGGRK